MIPSRPIRRDAARVGGLVSAGRVHGADREPVLTRARRLPVEAPEDPGDLRVLVVEARVLPGLPVVGADLDVIDAAIPGESDAVESRGRALAKRLPASRFVEARERLGDERRPPALALVKPLNFVVHNLDPRDPFDALLAEAAGDDNPHGVAVAARERLAIHLPGDEGGAVERLVEIDRVGVIIGSVEDNLHGRLLQARGFEQGAQRDTFPDGVAGETITHIITDAGKSRFLRRHAGERGQFVKREGARVGDLAIDTQSPE